MYKMAAQNKINTNKSFKFFRTKGNAPVHVLIVFIVVYMYLFLSKYVHYWRIHSKAGGIEILMSRLLFVI